MALLEDIEPPSLDQSDVEKTKSLTSNLNKNQLFDKTRLFLARVKYLRSFAHALVTKKIPSFAKNFLLQKRLVPHIAISFLSFVVLASNMNDRILTKAYNESMISTSPDTDYSIATSADGFTPLIKDDAGAVEKLALANESRTGFATSAGTVTTQITSRDETTALTMADGLPDNTANTVYYLVKDGDTLTGLGWKFNVKVATLKYLNDLENIDYLKPGSKLKIPPKDYEVSPALIAKKEKELKAKLASSSRSTVTRDGSLTNRAYASSSPKVRANPGSSKNGYPYGYCTYYVATRRYVPSNWGDAKRWLGSAKGAGYQTGSTPAAGAIVVTSESWWGHVAYVESVNGNSITISEMNAKGWGVTSRRTLDLGDRAIRGFIY